MIQGSDPEQRQAFAAFLSVLAVSLFGVFAVTAVASALPLQLLDPGWQLRLAGSLIDNGPIAALGLLAAWLAVVLVPGEDRLARRLACWRQWAIAAALGYLLLIPLQATAAWRGLSQVLSAEQRQEQALTTQLETLRGLLRSAPSAAALQSQWRARQGPQLSEADLALPLPALRSLLLERLQQVQNRVRDPAVSTQRRARIGEVVRNSVRLGVSSLFLALGFAAAGKGRRAPHSLLATWQRAWWRGRGRLQGRRRRGPWSDDEDYFREISPRE